MTDPESKTPSRPSEPAASDRVAEAGSAEPADPVETAVPADVAQPADAAAEEVAAAASGEPEPGEAPVVAPEAAEPVVATGAAPDVEPDSVGPAENEEPADGVGPADSVGPAENDQIAAAAPIETPAAESAVPTVPARRHHRLRFAGTFVAAFVGAAVVGSTAGAAAMYGYRSAYDGRIPVGVDVGGVDVSGLDPAAAESRVAASFASMTMGRIVLDAPSSDGTIDFADFGRSVDAGAAVERAMAVARDGDMLDQALASARTAFDGVTIAPTVSLDAGLLAAAIDRAVTPYERPARDAVVRSTPDGVLVLPSQAGLAVDRDAIFRSVLDQVGRADAPASIVIPLVTETVKPGFTDAEAEAAGQAAERMAQPLVLRHGEEEWKIAASTVRNWIIVVPTDDGRVVYDIDRVKVEAAITKLRSKIDRKAENATYLTSKAGKVIGVKASRNGRAVDSEITAERVARAVVSRAYGVPAESATVLLKSVEPELSTAEAEKTAPLLKMISGHTTWFPYGERNFFGANIWIPGRLINGTVVPPGQTFDFWKVVGFPTSARGFGAGGAIINGRTEPTGALAGGICSTSTTLFNAAAKAGLKLGARRMHYYYIDRYPLGLDATVWISSSGSRQNMTFTNDTKHPILIINRNWRAGSRGYVRFELWSVPNGRTVRFSRPIVRNVRPATTSVAYTSALAPGSARQEESEHDGMDVWVTRTVTDAKGDVIHKDTLRSHYARVNGLILKGKAAEATGDTP